MIEPVPAALVEELAETLLAVARATFDKRATRTYTGDPHDVLAFLVNSTSDEVQRLIADLEQTRDALVQTEKLAALGRVAAGMAHEMNQPLTVILALIDSLREDPDTRIGDRLDDVRLIEEAAEHLAETVDQVRTFARPLPFHLEPTPARAPVLGAVRLSTRTHAEVPVEVACMEALPELHANRERLQHVFLNLLLNAKYEVARHGGRRVAVSAEEGRTSVRYFVDDDGPGVPVEDRNRIFEPFFTTKTVGEGTGLGLSVSLGIVREHHGTLHATDSPLGGARFVVEIPRSQASSA